VRKQAERRNQPTTFEEFIRACHALLSIPLQVETLSRSTRGTIPPPTGKYCPTRLRPGEDCPVRQQAIYNTVRSYLQPTEQDAPRLFSSLVALGRDFNLAMESDSITMGMPWMKEELIH
jgi:hypothetical protein